MKLIKPHREVHITQTVNGGWILNIGCAFLPYTDLTAMLTDINNYIANSDKYEKEYNDIVIPPLPELSGSINGYPIFSNGMLDRTHE